MDVEKMIRLPEELNERLRLEAFTSRDSQAAIVRKALETELASREAGREVEAE